MVSILVGRLTISVNRTSGAPTQQVHLQEIYQQLFGLVNIFVVPLMSIVSALLYLKMRQLGGETLNAALAQTEEMDTKHSQWQQRMRSRVSLPTPRRKQ